VPDAILKKEGRLTPEEYAIVTTHAEITREIFSRINFEGIYRNIPEIAGAHHEKIDGSGYPRGIKGHEIPLGAKIIAVSDYFEAITAKRHYRDPMPLDEAFLLLSNNSGTLFDEQVVEAFFKYYAKTHLPGPAPLDGNAALSGFRNMPRIATQAQVAFRIDGKSNVAFSQDMSRHGVFVATDEGVSEGAPVELSITLTDNIPTIEAKGRVAWVNSRTALKKPNFPAGFGVELLEFKGMTEMLLESFLSSCTAEECTQGNQ